MEERDSQVIYDDERGHYLLLNLGWNEMERLYGVTIHIDVREDKIWIQQDWTDVGVANQLIEKGVPQEKIVLAFHAPYRRKHIPGFAAA